MSVISRKQRICVKLTELYVVTSFILLFYTSGSMYNVIYYKLNGAIKITTCVFLLLGIVKIRKKDYQKIGTFIICSLVLFLINMISGGNLRIYLFTALRLLCVYIFYLYCRKKNIDTLKTLYNIIIVCAAIYLICWVLFDIGPLTNRGKVIVINESIFTNYFNIYYRWHDKRKIFGMMFNSCNGPFSEPGLYMIWLNYALIYELFVKEKKNIKIVILLVLAVISTTSTMGALLLCGIFGMYLYFNTGKIIRLVGFIPIVMIMYVAVAAIWNERINSRVESVTGRIGDIYTLIKGILEYPILGNGIGNIDTTNSFFLYIYDFGLIGLCAMIIWFLQIIKSKKDIQLKVITLIWTTLSLFNEPIGYYNLFIFVMICLYVFFDKNNNGMVRFHEKNYYSSVWR